MAWSNYGARSYRNGEHLEGRTMLGWPSGGLRRDEVMTMRALDQLESGHDLVTAVIGDATSVIVCLRKTYVDLIEPTHRVSPQRLARVREMFPDTQFHCNGCLVRIRYVETPPNLTSEVICVSITRGDTTWWGWATYGAGDGITFEGHEARTDIADRVARMALFNKLDPFTPEPERVRTGKRTEVPA